ncbi:Anaphase-promoting complex subunit 4 [Echinococcus granulosus]|uniref:Anaphase-promoting complex subunit 4 n=1 Tax=Echinococcus granulosus TaxID=6210 RepID=A0A068WC09_ECHGR|nr:Anaphase-promoting complex subunit 4 [Echinococcus granulosus]CDS15197.1 anaphase promoting complex subunit 4 [Echinococcus granulosus]
MPPEYTTTVYEEKPIAKGKVSIASWSPKMDIIAIGSPSGIVSLHRYKMGINWEVHSSDSGGVTYLAWRPDGKVLSVAYECGRLKFLNLLDGSVLHSMEFGTAVIRHLTWVSCEHNVTTKQTIFPPFESLSIFTDDLFSNRQEVSQLSKPWLDPDSKPSVLIVHFADNTVRFYGCGFYELASLKLPVDCRSYECIMAQDFASFGYFSLTHQGVLTLNKIPSRALGERCLPMRNISFHIAALLHCKQLLEWSLKQLRNAWENTLLELDTKLTSYSRERLRSSSTWSLRNELLEIILFGHVSPQLREFFQRDWTPVAIRRAGIAMFKAYGSMKAITFQQLQYGLMRLICEASELLGCVRDRQICECFGLTEKVVVDLIRTAGSTLQKTLDLHLIVNHCSQYLRPFFQWFYGVALSSTKETSEKADIKVSPTERNLIITFVSERLRPFFVDGQLKSYQIELVEQYIRTGGTTKPVDELLGIQTTSENYKRAKLKDIIPLPTDFETKYFPEGIFVTTNASLADLIEVQLAGRIDKLAAFGGEQSSPSELFSEPERPVPLMANVNDISRLHICHFSCLMTSPQKAPTVPLLGLQALTGTVDRIAYVKPRDEGAVDVYDAILVFSSDPVDGKCGFSITVDGFVGDENPSKKPYQIVDLKFIEINTLVALIYREADASSTETLQWFIFIPLEQGLSGAPELATLSILLASSNLTDVLLRNPLPMSKLVTEPLQVHSLPRKPSWFAVNDERRTIFVMFDSICRVYIMERVTTGEEEGEDVDESL